MEQGLSNCWKNNGQEDLTYFMSDYFILTSLVSRNRIIHLKGKRFTQIPYIDVKCKANRNIGIGVD